VVSVSVIKPFSIFKLAGIGLISLLLAIMAQAQKADPNDPKNAERGAELIWDAPTSRLF
jgi:hypothetical protein